MPNDPAAAVPPADPVSGAVRASRALVIPGRAGLHARPAAKVVEIARRYAARVTLVHAELSASATDLLDVLYLAAPAGARVEVIAVGHDAAAAVDALAAFLGSLGEDA